MAADFIAITRVNRPNMGSETIAVANALRDIRDRIDALNDAAGHMVAAGPDYTMLEAQFGLTAGQGANFATLLGNLYNIMDTSTEVVGATRLAQLDEYVSRLAGQ